MDSRPNWFIAFPFEAEVALPEPPERIRCFAPTDLHITAAFLGPVESSVAEAAWGAVADVELSRCVVDLGSVELFGGRRPTAVSARIRRGARAVEEMMRQLQRRLVGRGLVRPDRRPPLPHVTVARIHRRATEEQRRVAIEWLEAMKLDATATLEHLALYTWPEDRSTRLFRQAARRGLSA